MMMLKAAWGGGERREERKKEREREREREKKKERKKERERKRERERKEVSFQIRNGMRQIRVDRPHAADRLHPPET
jgi:hypothetical protein